MAASRHMRCPAPLALEPSSAPRCLAVQPAARRLIHLFRATASRWYGLYVASGKVNSPALALQRHCPLMGPLMVPVMLPLPHARTGRCVPLQVRGSPRPRPTWAWHGTRKGMTMYVLQTACMATQSMRAVSSAHCFVWIRLHHAAPTALHQT